MRLSIAETNDGVSAAVTGNRQSDNAGFTD